MALRAVIFDYGMVLTGPPVAEAWAAIRRITALDDPRLSDLYWSLRPAYDEGRLTGLAFWQKLACEARLPLRSAQLDELNDWDARMWTNENPRMIAWQLRLKERGFHTAILSNMGDNVHARMKREFGWLSCFDVQAWSYVLGVAKPDVAIYRYVLAELGFRAEETFFLDDRPQNLQTARALGMQCHLFSTVEHLREDLVARGLDRELPLPE